MRKPLPMHASSRCGAKTRNGAPCKSGAMRNGRCRMHGGMSPGAPKGNQNAYKHGHYSADAIEARRQMAEFNRETRALINTITRNPNRSPSAPRFKRATQTISELGRSGPSFALIGGQGGPVDVGIEALDRIGTALIDQNIQQETKRVTDEATAKGLSEAERAHKMGGLPNEI